MSASQFNYYCSTDSGAPVLSGGIGSLLNLFTVCLVSGYGTKSGAGWTQPLANSGNRGCFKNSGSALTMFVNDAAPAVATEATANGWEIISSITGAVGAGINQFPLPSQQLTNGHVTIRKSTSNDTVPRYWQMFADAYTCYFFALTEVATSPGSYYAFWFGDMYSLGGTSDSYRCMILGGNTDNSAAGSNTTHSWDLVMRSMYDYLTSSSLNGMYAARNFAGTGGSILQTRLGDASVTFTSVTNTPMVGVIASPNAPDQSAILAPMRLCDSPPIFIRGRLRGLYFIAHPLTAFGDGQILQGANEYAGKTFQVVKQGPNAGFIAVEISATVETN